MATMYVSWVGGVENSVAKEPLKAETVTTSLTSAKSAVNPGGAIAVVFSDAAHYVNVGPEASVTAAASNGIYVPANVEREFAVGNGEAIAAVTLV